MFGNKVCKKKRKTKFEKKMMKKFTLFFATAATMLFGSVTSASAQQTEEDIDWINYAVDVNTAINSYGEGKPDIDGIYLCNWNPTTDTYTFVTAGGEYGTQAIVTNRGMRMYVKSSYGSYQFEGSLYNPNFGSLLGAELKEGGCTERVFLDRNESYGLWRLTAGDVNGKTYYTITNAQAPNSANTLSVESKNNTLQMVAPTANSTDVNRWLLIPRDAFREAILGVTHQTNLEVSGLFLNTRFVRYMDRDASWKWYDINNYNNVINEDDVVSSEAKGLGIAAYKAYRSMAPGAECIKDDDSGNNSSYDTTLDYAKEYGNFCAAEMKTPIIMRQSYDNVPAGTYTITAQAFVSNDDNDITNERNIAYLFASNGQAGGTPDGALIPILDETDQANFTDNYYSIHKQMAFTINDDDYFRANVAAADFLGTGGNPANHDASIYNPNMTYKLIQISINVPATNPDGETGTLMIGVAKYEDAGTLYVDNIRVYYSGTSEFGINAYGTSNVALSNSNPTGIDEFQYGYARAFNLARDFGADADGDGDIDNPQWEALVLPVNLTATQVKSAFGDKVKLSKLKGLANNGNQIRFVPEDLDSDPNKVVLTAGECYVIKVTNAPDVARDDSYDFDVTSNELGQDAKLPVTYKGPIYQINGVTREYTLTDLLNKNGMDYSNGLVTKSYETDDGTLDYRGFFCWSTKATKAGDYVVSRGKMYHLTSGWENLTGTMWLLRDRENSNALSFDFGDGQTTDINNIVTETAPESATADGVYNLNGQKVAEGTSLNGLAKGIYIVNGRKHVVR